MSRLGFIKKTAAIKVFLRDLSQEQYSADIAALELHGMLEDLAASQDAFEQEYQSKVEYNSGSYSKLVQARDDAIFRLKNCMRHIDTLEMDNPGMHEQLIAEINVIINHVQSVARARKTRAANHEAGNEPAPAATLTGVA